MVAQRYTGDLHEKRGNTSIRRFVAACVMVQPVSYTGTHWARQCICGLFPGGQPSQAFADYLSGLIIIHRGLERQCTHNSRARGEAFD